MIVQLMFKENSIMIQRWLEGGSKKLKGGSKMVLIKL